MKLPDVSRQEVLDMMVLSASNGLKDKPITEAILVKAASIAIADKEVYKRYEVAYQRLIASLAELFKNSSIKMSIGEELNVN